MVRSSKHHLTFTNQVKIDELNKVFDIYQSDLQIYIKFIYNKFLPIDKLVNVKNLPVLQLEKTAWRIACFKQAQEMFKSSLEAIKTQRYKKYQKLYSKCIKNNKHCSFTNKKYSELKLNNWSHVRINVKSLRIYLSWMMCGSNGKGEIKLYKSEMFDIFLRINLPYKKLQSLHIPLKHHRVSNKYIIEGYKRKETIGIGRKKTGEFYVALYWEKENPVVKKDGVIIGIDLGVKKLISDSNGTTYGTEMEAEYKEITKKKRGSNNYKQRVIHKNNTLNIIIKDFFNYNSNIKILVCEDLFQLRNKSKLGHKQLNKQQYFTYGNIIKRIEQLCQEKGISLVKVSPSYTSQTCSSCGHTDKKSRNGESFICTECGYSIDADYNASLNILNRGTYNPSTTAESNVN